MSRSLVRFASGGGPVLLVCDGDSITYSQLTATPRGDWPFFACQQLGPRFSPLNIAVNSAETSHFDHALDGDMPVNRRIYVLNLGLNNVRGGETGASLIAYLQAQVVIARSMGFPRVVLIGEYSNYLVEQVPNPVAKANLDMAIDAFLAPGHLGADIAADWRPVVSVADMADGTLFPGGHPTALANRTKLAAKFVADVASVIH